jgi:hypothetical protein
MKLKHCTDMFILSKDKRPVNNLGQYSTIDNAATVPYQKFKAARDHGFTISIKLGPIGDTGYSIYCIDCDHCDFKHPVYKWMQSLIDTPQLVELSQSELGAHIFIVKKTTEQFETRFMDFTGQQLEVWTRVRHIVSPSLERIVDVELRECNVAVFDKLMELSDEQERIKAEQYEREREKLYKQHMKKNYSFVRPETDISVFAKSDKRLYEILNSEPEDVDNSATDLALVRKITYYYDTKDIDIVKDVFERTDWFGKKDEYHLKKFYRPGYLDRLIALS